MPSPGDGGDRHFRVEPRIAPLFSPCLVYISCNQPLSLSTCNILAICTLPLHSHNGDEEPPLQTAQSESGRVSFCSRETPAKSYRCDGNQPCANCKSGHIDCLYEVEPVTKGKSEVILETVLRLEDRLAYLTAQICSPRPAESTTAAAPSPQTATTDRRLLESSPDHSIETSLSLLVMAMKYRTLLSSTWTDTGVDTECLRRMFWSCFCVESDYIAERAALPQTGVSDMESMVPYPTYHQMSEEDGQREQSSLYFLACISVRRLLNRVHDLLCVLETGVAFDDARFPHVVTELDHQLEEWRCCLPPELHFNIDTSPATSTHGGLLRQRYLTCRAVILRSA